MTSHAKSNDAELTRALTVKLAHRRPPPLPPRDPDATAHCPQPLLAGLLAGERAHAHAAPTARYEETVVDLQLPARVAADTLRAANGGGRPMAHSPALAQPAATPRMVLTATVPLPELAAAARQPARPARARSASAAVMHLEQATRVPKQPRSAPRGSKRPMRAWLAAIALLLAGVGAAAAARCRQLPAPSARAERVHSAPATHAREPTGNSAPTALSGSAPTAAATTIQAAAASRATASVADHTPTTVAAANPAFAVDALARGDYASALEAYRALAHDHPDDHSYAFIAATLHHQLARTCAEHGALGEQPCTVP
ncbi:MAG TPA: hypothetical protein VF331_11355 [Polyangiales bacterium]